MSYKSPLTVDIADTSPTTDPEPSQPSPHCVEPKLELTADGEPEPTATYEPSHGRATELTIAPEPVISDQLRKPATELGMGESIKYSDSTERSSTHCTMAEGEQRSMDCVLPTLLPLSPACPKMSVCLYLYTYLEKCGCLESYASTITTTEVVPLTLKVHEVAMWCVWAAHAVSKRDCLIQVFLVNYPHFCSSYKLHSVQCFFVRSHLYYLVCVNAASLIWTTLMWIIKDCLSLSSSSSCVSPSSHCDNYLFINNNTIH